MQALRDLSKGTPGLRRWGSSSTRAQASATGSSGRPAHRCPAQPPRVRGAGAGGTLGPAGVLL